MIYIARLILLMSVYTGSFLLAQKTGYVIIAFVGGLSAGVLEGLVQTGRLFVTSIPKAKLARVLSAIPFLAAVIVVAALGIHWVIVIAYLALWLAGNTAVFIIDAYLRGA